MNILVYGDSNSWGYLDDGTGVRFARRWPVVMAGHLGEMGCEVRLVEECLPGRTSGVDDPDPQVEGQHYNGARHLVPILLSHQPLDIVMIMLGTNDFKLRMNRSADDIATSIQALAMQAAATPAGHGGWQAASAPGVHVMCPPPLGKRADDREWERFDEWKGGREKSLALGDALAQTLAQINHKCICAAQVVQSSDIDPIHWSAESHERFGVWVAECIAGATPKSVSGKPPDSTRTR